jgi:hypothetical protein
MQVQQLACFLRSAAHDNRQTGVAARPYTLVSHGTEAMAFLMVSWLLDHLSI